MSKNYTQSTASLQAVTVDTHILDANKILVYPGSGDRNEKVNILDIIGDSASNANTINNIYGWPKSEELEFNTNTVQGTLDNATATGVLYSKAHFINNAKISSITLPFTYNSSVTSVGRLCAQVFDEKDNIIASAYSANKFSFNDTSATSATFEFDNFYIPKSYKSIIFSFVKSDKVVPNVISNTNTLTFRCRPIKFNNTFTFDNDDCQVYNGSDTYNWLVGMTIRYFECNNGLIERVINLENKKVTFKETEAVYSLANRPSTTGEANAIHSHQSRVPHNAPIAAVEIPISRNTTSEPLYLVAYTVTTNGFKTLIGRSTNKVVVSAGKNAKWHFENPFTVPEGMALELFIAKEDTVISPTKVPSFGIHIALYLNNSGTDTIRNVDTWHNREVYLIFNTVVNEVPLENKLDDYAKVNEANTFTATNTFNGSTTFNGSSTFQTGPYSITVDERGLWSYYPVTSEMGFVTDGALSVAPLGFKTAYGADAYALKVSKSEGVQIWGTHFAEEDEWSDKALKICHRNLALLGDHTEPTTLTFDNANIVEFKVMPNDGSTANDGQGAVYDFQAWQWDDNLHTSKSANCPVQILKNNAGSLTERSVLNKAELDENYIIANEDNKHIVETLNDTLSVGYAQGKIKISTWTNGYSLKIGGYEPVSVGTGHDSSSYLLEEWTDVINNSKLPFRATYEYIRDNGGNVSEANLYITAVNVGEGYCLPFHLYLPDGRADSDCIYSGETLTLQTEQIKKIDYLSDAKEIFAHRDTDNTFKGSNTFEQTVTAKEDIIVTNGIITFEDLIDGTVVERSGASGYRYVEGIPASFNNGICYDIGEISDTTNLSNITFSAKGKLVQTCELWFTTPATPPTTHQWPANIYWIDSANGSAPALIASKNYRIVFRQEPNKIIASIAYLY